MARKARRMRWLQSHTCIKRSGSPQAARSLTLPSGGALRGSPVDSPVGDRRRRWVRVLCHLSRPHPSPYDIRYYQSLFSHAKWKFIKYYPYILCTLNFSVSTIQLSDFPLNIASYGLKISSIVLFNLLYKYSQYFSLYCFAIDNSFREI